MKNERTSFYGEGVEKAEALKGFTISYNAVEILKIIDLYDRPEFIIREQARIKRIVKDIYARRIEIKKAASKEKVGN